MSGGSVGVGVGGEVLITMGTGIYGGVLESALGSVVEGSYIEVAKVPLSS